MILFLLKKKTYMCAFIYQYIYIKIGNRLERIFTKLLTAESPPWGGILKSEAEGNSYVLVTKFSEYMGMWLDC